MHVLLLTRLVRWLYSFYKSSWTNLLEQEGEREGEEGGEVPASCN